MQKGHGISFADFDHDGDQDVLAQYGGAFPSDKFFPSLYKNPGSGNHWLTLRLQGTQSNARGHRQQGARDLHDSCRQKV